MMLYAITMWCSLLGTAEATPVVQPPPFVQHRVSQNDVRAVVTVKPALVQPGQSVEIRVELARNPSTPNVSYGAVQPLEGLPLQSVMVPYDPKGNIQARQMVPMESSGAYGCAFTPGSNGPHAVYVQTMLGGVQWQIKVPVAVGQWPVPADTVLPPIPAQSKLVFAQADVAHGQALCSTLCRYQPPLMSVYANSMQEDVLLRTLLQDQYHELSAVQRHDVMAYVRTLYVGVKDFFPKATHIAWHSSTLNAYAKERLGVHKVLVPVQESTATVFVAYGPDADTSDLISTQDAVKRDLLKPSDKKGYLVFFKMDAYEIAMRLDKEPVYAITGLRARSLDGKDATALNAQLAGFVGQGRFNDPTRFSSRDVLAKKIIPMYLMAAEYATAYVGDEREFTAFNAEFQ